MVNTVWHKTVTGKTWLRSATALSFVALLVVISAELTGATFSGGAERHAPHVLSAATGSVVSVGLDHPHAQREESAAAPDTFAAAVLPRAVTILAIFAVVVAADVFWSGAMRAVGATQRGPPLHWGSSRLSGWQLLVRFCIDRR
ncbi:hypothetical protein [Mycolicibacterium fortuitum]|uniref:hypothetical protein n=1 Tax=Mycolicibacterium fortuitum TaxID=1766 RepID=UPI001131F4FC|nr:hypothetical protein [Mycolicibacterium fortuitum]MDG5781545.1 hypothetical protein [Mycolicibacterium fortuitum]TPW92134.1 hypothetical protein FKW78_24600 [Mycolicibacterium fortuitum]